MTPNWHTAASKPASGKGRAGRLRRRAEIDVLAGLELLARHFEHRRVEVGCRQTGIGWQQVTQPARDDAGPRGNLQHARRSVSGHATRQVGSEIDKDYRTQVPVVVVWDSACKAARRLIGHHLSSFFPTGGS